MHDDTVSMSAGPKLDLAQPPLNVLDCSDPSVS